MRQRGYYLEHIIVYINLNKSLRGVLLVGQRSNHTPSQPSPLEGEGEGGGELPRLRAVTPSCTNAPR